MLNVHSIKGAILPRKREQGQEIKRLILLLIQQDKTLKEELLRLKQAYTY
jgi:hypothetical protein